MPYSLPIPFQAVNKIKRRANSLLHIVQDGRGYMDKEMDVSCWGVTMKAVLALGAILAIVYFFGAFDTAAIAAK